MRALRARGRPPSSRFTGRGIGTAVLTSWHATALVAGRLGVEVSAALQRRVRRVLDPHRYGPVRRGQAQEEGGEEARRQLQQRLGRSAELTEHEVTGPSAQCGNECARSHEGVTAGAASGCNPIELQVVCAQYVVSFE